MVTFENGENYSVRVEILNNGPIFDLIRNEKALLAQKALKCATILI